MARQRNKGNKICSSMSDEQLAIILSNDYKRNPTEFSPTQALGISDSKSFLHKTSAMGIDPMKKWL